MINSSKGMGSKGTDTVLADLNWKSGKLELSARVTKQRIYVSLWHVEAKHIL